MSAHQATAAFTLTHDDVTFRWTGGAYVETGRFDDEGWTAYDCINVWDYETGNPRIARTLEAFQQACEEWIAAQEYERCPLCHEAIDYCAGHSMDEADDLYFAEVAQVVRGLHEPATDDVILAAFGMVEPPAYIIADSDPTADEVASVRALLGFS